MKFVCKIFFCAILIVNKITEAKPQKRVANGWEVSDGIFPSNVKIEIHSWFTKGTCSGVLLDEITVLTAAHCINKRDYRYIIVYAGDDSSSFSSFYRHKRVAKKIIIHENFSDEEAGIVNDLALILLDLQLPKNKYVDYANLPEDELTKPGDTIYIVGWGEPNTNEISATNQTVMDNEECHSTLHTLDILEDEKLCSVGKDVETGTACNGDSGAPAYFIDARGLQWVVGIMSYGLKDVPCGEPGSPNFITRVSYYYDWIKSNHEKIKLNNSISIFDLLSLFPPLFVG